MTDPPARPPATPHPSPRASAAADERDAARATAPDPAHGSTSDPTPAAAPPDHAALARLPTEQPNPRSADLDLLTSAQIARLVFEEDAAVHRACLRVADAVGVLADRAADALRGGGRLLYVGAGSSGRLGVLDASELPPTFGIDPDRVPALIAGGRQAVFAAREGAEDDPLGGAAAIAEHDVGPADCVCGISASGVTPFVGGALQEATRRGASTGVVVCGDPAPALRTGVVIRLETGPEVLAGSTRMKAGSATKMVLNALSLATMVRLGKVHGNRMVDLRAGSRKLRERARRLVEELGGVDRRRARALLAEADGGAKLAILMARTGAGAAAARARLAAAHGSLRQALGESAAAARDRP